MNFLEMTKEELLALFYIFGNAISLIICNMLFIKNRKNKQTRAQYFNFIVLSLMIYFVGDAFWAPCYFKLIPNYEILIRFARMIYYIASCFLGYFWFNYIEIILGSSFIYKKKNKKLLALPVILGTIAAILICAFLDPSEKNIHGYLTGLGLCVVPFGFIIVAGIRTFIKRKNVTDEALKNRLTIIFIWPIIILIFSILQLFIAELPIFCFGASLITVSLYIYNQDSLIFTDPLTGVNNRNMLNRYINNLDEDNTYYVLMIDIDKFKSINDTMGHLEGDRALKYMAKLLNEEVSKRGDFIARYGGDEFIIILKTEEESSVVELMNSITTKTSKTKDDLGYSFTASIGYSIIDKNEPINASVERADKNLYEAKEEAHKQGLR